MRRIKPAMSNTFQTGIILFDDVEDLDFVGPIEVLSVANRLNGTELFTIVTLATKTPIYTAAGLSVNVSHLISEEPFLDLLIVPGGKGVRRELENPVFVKWLKAKAADADQVLSVCTGALLLAKAGALKGLKATTHPAGATLLREIEPDLTFISNARVVRNDRITVSGGIASGIDGALAVVAALGTPQLADRVAGHMEYVRP